MTAILSPFRPGRPPGLTCSPLSVPPELFEEKSEGTFRTEPKLGGHYPPPDKADEMRRVWRGKGKERGSLWGRRYMLQPAACGEEGDPTIHGGSQKLFWSLELVPSGGRADPGAMKD